MLGGRCVDAVLVPVESESDRSIPALTGAAASPTESSAQQRVKRLKRSPRSGKSTRCDQQNQRHNHLRRDEIGRQRGVMD